MRRRLPHHDRRTHARRRSAPARRCGFESLEARRLLTGLPPGDALPAERLPQLDGTWSPAEYQTREDLGIDYGDAPATYPVLQSDDGAGHQIVAGFHLGHAVDAEADGQPSVMADADSGDDGVTFTPIVSGQMTTITVQVSGRGFLDGWLDLNGDGDWDDPDEQILYSEPVVSGSNAIAFRVVATAVGVPTYARFRLSSIGGLSPRGIAPDGEVEDYVVTIARNPWQNISQPWDVNGDSRVSPLDALLIINLINANPPISFTPLPVPPDPGFRPPPYYDVNGDGYVTPMDVLLIINYLNGNYLNGARTGEGEIARDAEPLPIAIVAPDWGADQSELAERADLSGVAAGSVAAPAQPATPFQPLPVFSSTDLPTDLPTELLLDLPTDLSMDWPTWNPQAGTAVTDRPAGDGLALGVAWDEADAELVEVLEDLWRVADELQLVPASSRAAFFARLASS